MSLRMMRYMSLHGLQLLSDHEPPLPVIVPVVLYTGERPWNADLAAGEMFEGVPPPHRLQVPCHLVDLFRLEVAEGSENVMELLAVVMRGESDAELLGAARALYRRLVALGNKPMEGSFFDLIRALCEEKWPNENWKDCANMAELVGALEERTETWPEKWHALYEARCKAEGRAEGIEEGRAQESQAVLSGLEKAVRTRFGASVAQSFGRRLEIVRQAGAARNPEIRDAIVQCVMVSESAEQLLAGLQSISTETA